jgi:glycosyltransferase involved in cell wall biosynthesis
MLVALIDSLGAELLYNANSTTLFYDFAPRLKSERPAVRIVDHLYDHQVGYIERYGPELLASVDACVAENHRIAEVLTSRRGWPAARVPVIWPCGRPTTAFPAGAAAVEARRRLRGELGLGPDDLVILTAARMHPQKRPLDLVELAHRVADLDRVRFLVVGGGELEAAVDRAIAASGARVLRLPFRDDIPDLIAASDAGCLVSDFEGLPVFLLECLQAGRPFLGTDVGDMGELLRSTGAGLVVDTPGNIDALEAAVRRLADAAELARLTANAAAAAARFDPAACAEAYADVFLGRTP